jgi:hypothetical protein
MPLACSCLSFLASVSAQTSKTSFIPGALYLVVLLCRAKAVPLDVAKVAITAFERFQKDYKDVKNV